MTTVEDPRANERFHMYPMQRIKAVSLAGGVLGACSGFYDGVRLSSLRYLTENSHRLPKTVGGWYFYHKKKNYIMIINGSKEAAKQALKFSSIITVFFGLEAIIDKYIRYDTIDFLNTTIASALTFGTYGIYNNLSTRQTINYMKRGSLLGLSMGVSEDLLIWSRGGKIWYMDKIGIMSPHRNKDDDLFHA